MLGKAINYCAFALAIAAVPGAAIAHLPGEVVTYSVTLESTNKTPHGEYALKRLLEVQAFVLTDAEPVDAALIIKARDDDESAVPMYPLGFVQIARDGSGSPVLGRYRRSHEANQIPRAIWSSPTPDLSRVPNESVGEMVVQGLNMNEPLSIKTVLQADEHDSNKIICTRTLASSPVTRTAGQYKSELNRLEIVTTYNRATSQAVSGSISYDMSSTFRDGSETKTYATFAEVSRSVLDADQFAQLADELEELLKIENALAGNDSLMAGSMRQASQPNVVLAERLMDSFRRRFPEAITAAAIETYQSILAGEKARSTKKPQAGLTPPSPLQGKPAPDFTLKMLDGKDVSLADFKGKLVLLHFWGSTCGTCRVEAPHINRLYKKYKDKGFVVLAINAYNENEQAVSKFVKAHDIAYPIAMMGRDVSRKYSARALPSSFWIDRDGKIFDYHVGFAPGTAEQFETKLKGRL